MSTFIPPAPPASTTPPSLMVPVAYGPGAEEMSGSYGPVIGMLAVVAVLAMAAVALGRLCFGRRALGHAGRGRDLEAWVERTCGPCVGVVTAKEEEEGAATATATALSVPAAPGGTAGEASSSGGGS